MAHAIWSWHLPLHCKKCNKTHLREYNCEEIRCKICHDVHSYKEIVQGLCPKIYQIALKMRDALSFPCKICMGAGKCSKIIITTYRTPQCEKKKPVQINKQSHQSSVIKEIVHPLSDIKCEQCQGLGQIHRFIYCCQLGCLNCHFKGMIQNTVWITYKRNEKRKPFFNYSQEQIQCSICFQLIKFGQKMYRMECQHKFHRFCIIKWMEHKSECPLCRRKDIYFSKKLINQLSKENLLSSSQIMGEHQDQELEVDYENLQEGSEFNEFGSEVQQTQFLILPNQE